MTERKHPLAKCEECPIYEKGRYVPSRFPKTSDGKAVVAFVGEAPANTEVAKKEPFVGPSGKLLDEVLGHYQVSRDQVLLTNATLCRFPPSMGELPTDAIECCRPRLKAELDLVAPRTVIALGNSAIRAVHDPKTAKRGVNALRAGPPRYSETLARPVVSTFHPAACLRNQGNFPSMVTDIGKALQIDPPQAWYEPTTRIVEHYNFHNVISRVQKLNAGYGLVVDTESGNDKDSSYGNTHLENLLCIGIGPMDPTNQDTVYVFPQSIIDSYHRRDTFSTMLRECGIIAHNGKYDCTVLEAALEQRIPLPLVFDTMLAHYALDERPGIHGLKYLATEILGTPDYEAEIKPHIINHNYATIPSDILYKYNAFDVHATRLLYSYLSNQISEQGLSRINSHLLRSSPTLAQIEKRGLGFDLAYSDSVERRLTEEQEALEATIPFNPRSHVQVRKYFDGLGITIPNTEEETLVRLCDQLPEDSLPAVMTKRLLDARGYTKMLSTYVTGLQEKVTNAGTIHPSFLLHRTTTGRLSSRNPNAQNIPRAEELKRQFVPSRQGNVFVQCDFSQAELRVITWLARDEGMRALFNDPTRDVFVELCRTMFQGFDSLDDHTRKELRVLTKKFAYGILYGRGAAAIAKEQGIPVKQAQEYRNLFLEQVPDIVKYQNTIREKVKRCEDLINPFGRHRRTYLYTSANRINLENEALSFMPQSTASDICLEAANRLNAEGVDIRNLIHDAILAETTVGNSEQTASLMQRVMREVGEEVTEGYIRFDTEAKIGPSWDKV